MPRNRIRVSAGTARLAAFLVGTAFLAALELGARSVLLPTRLDNVLAILRRDPELFWTQKPFLREEFFGTFVETDRHGLRIHGGKGVRRILTLGASPTFGWGVRADETYSARLQEGLDGVEVVNGGMIGYSSYQGLGFLKRHWDALRPDVVVVAYVINDVDSYRFFRSDGLPDKLLEPRSGFLTAAQDLLGASALYRGLARLLSAVSGEARLRGAYPGSVRVGIEDYRRNLREIVSWARSRGSGVVFLKMPVNLPTGRPPVSAWRAWTAFREGLWLKHQGDCARAAVFFRKAIEFDEDLSRAHYHLGDCARRAGRRDEASGHLRRVKEAESHRSARDAKRYNAAMAGVARELDVPLVDAVAAFAAHRGGYLYVDPRHDTIHPNPAGHEVIARALLERLDPIVSGAGRGLPTR